MQTQSLILIALASLSLLISTVSVFFAYSSRSRSNELSYRLQALLKGKDGKDLEQILFSNVEEIRHLDKEIQELYEISNRINSLAFKSIHKVGLVRFNPFKDIGGDQSFAVAFLDGTDSGSVISSLHTREGTRVYAKPIIKGEADGYTLTDEEKQAIKTASSVKTRRI